MFLFVVLEVSYIFRTTVSATMSLIHNLVRPNRESIRTRERPAYYIKFTHVLEGNISHGSFPIKDCERN